MAPIPEKQDQLSPEAAYELLQKWFKEKDELSKLKFIEHTHRGQLADFYFPSPVVGTNRLDLGGGFDLKLVAGLDYKVDEAALDNVTAAQIKKLKLPWDDLFVYKPSLSLRAYNALSSEQKAFVDTLLDIKPKSPQLEIVPAAKDNSAHIPQQEAPAAAPADNNPPPPAEAPSVVTVAEEAKPGDCYSDGTTWWQLGEDIEWSEVLDETLLRQLLALEAAQAPPTKPKRSRKK